MATPDYPTFIPQVVPSKKQQLHQESDIKSLLKKPYVLTHHVIFFTISYFLVKYCSHALIAIKPCSPDDFAF